MTSRSRSPRERIPERVVGLEDTVRHRGYVDVQRYPDYPEDDNDGENSEMVDCTTSVSVEKECTKIVQRVVAKMKARSSLTMYYDNTISQKPVAAAE